MFNKKIAEEYQQTSEICDFLNNGQDSRYKLFIKIDKDYVFDLVKRTEEGIIALLIWSMTLYLENEEILSGERF